MYHYITDGLLFSHFGWTQSLGFRTPGKWFSQIGKGERQGMRKAGMGNRNTLEYDPMAKYDTNEPSNPLSCTEGGEQDADNRRGEGSRDLQTDV